MQSLTLSALILRPAAGHTLIDATPAARLDLMRLVAMAALATGHPVQVETDTPEVYADLIGLIAVDTRRTRPTVVILDRVTPDAADYLDDPGVLLVASRNSVPPELHYDFSTDLVAEGRTATVHHADGTEIRPISFTDVPPARVLSHL